MVEPLDKQQQQRAIYTQETASTIQQTFTELECAPFFVNLSQLPASQIDHLRETGLLLNDSFDVCLLRDKHAAYLETVWTTALRPSFVSLDSSRTWMIYWCLHAADLMGRLPSSDQVVSMRIVTTLRTCFMRCTVTLEREVVDKDPLLLSMATPNDTDETVAVVSMDAGGFGGGPDQMPHAATTYAAVLALCILAPTNNAALELLQEIRSKLYPWLVSLHCPTTGSYRMHADGEIDVRATYCVVVTAKLLNLLTDTLTHKAAAYVSTCQTFEGGFGGEPGAEAHGGYTFCAIAALELLGALLRGCESVDLPAVAGWLARRQMSYEGGFSGRANKLVDGCYSFWQGAAMAIVSHALRRRENCEDDPWLAATTTEQSPAQSLFDSTVLERYILLCSQDVNGGLRDKPSKGRDFYHCCYCLSGLSIAQHYGAEPHFGHVQHSAVQKTHPCFNVRVEHAAFVLHHFQNVAPLDAERGEQDKSRNV